MRLVSDSDSTRKQNRGLVLEALRLHGPSPRTQLAAETGLSHATITAISQDMVAQGLLIDFPEVEKPAKARGRPAVRIGFNRQAAFVVLIEMDAGGARCSLVDYGGTLVDRVQVPLPQGGFASQPASSFLLDRVEQLRSRNGGAMTTLRRVAVSVQGILDRGGARMVWSPVPHLAGTDIVGALSAALGVPVTLYKRGRLLAEGTRWLDPDLREASVATVFVGSTVAMGMTFRGQILGRGEEGGTEFGHMNHVPNGALCRCGMRGCIEAYAADYGVLRTAYSVPETAQPAVSVPPAEYDGLIARAQRGDRAVTHAFNMAGRAIGFGISRLLAVFDPTHLIIVGPGARAFELMKPEIEAALATSLMTRINGAPIIRNHRDESEPIFRGLMMKTLTELDQTDFANLPNS